MLFPNKTSKRVISREKQLKKFREIVFFDVHLKGSHLVCLKIYNSKKCFFVIFMRR